ncbi:MAG: response regulator [Desulfobacterales bacterium]|nr:response regulator [Desulfobacterales bacterium]
MGKQDKILIIDDNEDVLSTLYQFLSHKHYQVVSATNGLDALKLFDAEAEGFDLIITDLVMPSISGVAVIAIVKDKQPDIPIIAITGWGEHPEALATEAKADVVLEKPFELNALEKLIKKLLAKREKTLKTDQQV